MRYLMSLFCLFLLAGCATKSTLGPGGTTSLTDPGQTNLAIIKAAEASGSFGVALKAAEQEVSERPDNAEARLILARLQTLTGRPSLAQETLLPLQDGGGTASRSAPKSGLRTGVLLEQARARLALHDTAQARDDLENCLASRPPAATRREARKLLAVSYDDDGRHEESGPIYEELLAERDEVSVRYNYGRSLLAAKSYGKSATTLMPLVDMAELPQARLVAAAALANNGEPKAARSLLQGYMPDDDINRILGEAHP